MYLTPKPTTATLLAIGLTLVGCQSAWLSSSSAPSIPDVRPGDFVGEPQQAQDTNGPEQPLGITAKQSQPASSDTAEQANAPRSEQALPVDAMVGHINGEAVYADQIFDVNLVAQLESFGQRFDRDAFSNAAGGVIQDRLQGIIINKLILGEAERNLQEGQRRGIEARVQSERDELLRFYGQGSLAKAKAECLEKRGKELDQYLADFREELVIGSYIRSKVSPRIVVNQRDVERYYADNIDKYQQPDTRTICLIRAVDQVAAKQIETRLSKGQAFDKLANDPTLNQYNHSNAGVFNNGNPIPGDQVIGLAPVNDALLELESGQYAGPIAVGEATFFVLVIERTPGVKITLADAQIGIEQKLRASQFEKHALRFRLELLRRGSYSDPAEMGNKLLDIAFARYDR